MVLFFPFDLHSMHVTISISQSLVFALGFIYSFANCALIFSSIEVCKSGKSIHSGGFRGGAPGARPPTAQNFLNFMPFFCKIWQNHMLAPPLEGWRPLLWGILDPPLIYLTKYRTLFISQHRLI